MKTKNYIKPFFLLLVLLLLSGQMLIAQNQPVIQKSERVVNIHGNKYYIHTVAGGQTLYGISKAYDVTIQDIIKANQLNGEIKAGQEIRIPWAEDVVSIKHKDFLIHKVEAKETLYSISVKYNISVDDIRQANPEMSESIKIGDEIKIPNAKNPLNSAEENTNEKKKGVTHIIQPGETLYGISKMYETTVEELVKNNPFLIDGVKAGMEIFIKAFEDIVPVPFMSDEKLPRPIECDTAYPKNNLNVALLMPFFLDDTEKSDVDEGEREEGAEKNEDKYHRSFSFIQFYEGIKIAIDSLAAEGLSVRLYVYDTSDDTNSIRRILRKPEFFNMDLIIGPFYVEQFRIVSDLMKDKNTLLVNPVTQNQDVLANSPNVFKVVPSERVQLAQIARYIAKTYHGANIITVHNGLNKEKERAAIFRQELKSGFLKLMQADSDCEFNYNNTGIEGLTSLLDSTKLNVIATLASGEIFVTSYLAELSALSKTYEIVLFGLPTWKRYGNIEPEYFMNVKLHLYSPKFVDYEDSETKEFIKVFRDRYKTEPNNFAFLGFDVAWYFMSGLKEFGDNFEKCLCEVKFKKLQSGMKFFRQNSNGFENQAVSIYKFEDYKMIEVNNK